MKFGMENLKKVSKIFFKLINVVDAAGHESTWSERMTQLMGILPTLLILGSVEWSLLDDEIKDIDDAERVEFTEYCKQEFDIIDEELEAFVESVLDFDWGE